jgi:hypothetical protein
MNQTRSDQIGSARRGSDAEVLAAVAKMLEVRSKRMGSALDRFAEGTTERAWQAGYVSAMRDTLKMITGREGEYPMTMDAAHPATSGE